MVSHRHDWEQRRRAHEKRVDALIGDHLVRRRSGVKHPVLDFLFTYYSFRPAQLRRWHPGIGEAEPVKLRPESVRWIHDLLVATANRPGHFGCFGMHEWAMVYRQSPEDLRHNAWPLRLSPERTAAVVEERGVRCSHFDAFRFFTPAARPLNVLTPTRAGQIELDQPGCLHANMDLYKWSYKLYSVVPSELIADCFELARDIRALDMRASPYDLADLGYEPVRVETPEGRTEYAAAQRAFADRAAPLRNQLITVCATALPQPNGPQHRQAQRPPR